MRTNIKWPFGNSATERKDIARGACRRQFGTLRYAKLEFELSRSVYRSVCGLWNLAKSCALAWRTDDNLFAREIGRMARVRYRLLLFHRHIVDCVVESAVVCYMMVFALAYVSYVIYFFGFNVQMGYWFHSPLRLHHSSRLAHRHWMSTFR